MSEARVATRPADRYRRPATPNRRLVAVIGGILVIFLTGWLGWIALSMSDNPVSFSLTGQEVPSPTEAVVTFQVSMDPGRRAVCTVRATDSAMTIVGWTDAPVGPSSQRTFTVTVRVPTMQQAAGGEVKACVLA